MKPVTTDIYDFAELATEGYTYVDKTAFVHRLVAGKIGKQFFLARPRRFGKSLLVSTFKYLFLGRRELFKGLAIDGTDYDWPKYPVIHLDMGSCQADTVAEFKVRLVEIVREQAKLLGVDLSGYETLAGLFSQLIVGAAAGSELGKVVVLVDEYDKPLLGHLGKPEAAEFQSALKAFYSVLKTKEAEQRFTFITGVSKFARVSIFSDLNNLRDLSMAPQFATLLGYTHGELHQYFDEQIAAFGASRSLASEAAFAEFLHWYDGYRFTAGAEPVVNPVSLGLALFYGTFKNYWSDTAVPTFLTDILRNAPRNLDRLVVSDDELGAYEPTAPSLIPLLFQTGYFTIVGSEEDGVITRYQLDFPNLEVRMSFNHALTRTYTRLDDVVAPQSNCRRALAAGDLGGFFAAMKQFFDGLPYDISDRAPEQVYQAVFCAILNFIGIAADPEIRTAAGRIDATLTTATDVYVMEFKRNQSAEAALAQIRDGNYAAKYVGRGRPVTLVGVNFDSSSRSISEWKAEKVK